MPTLYRLLTDAEQLRLRRHPLYYRNRFVRLLLYFLAAYYAAILIFIGVVLPQALRSESTGTAAFHYLDGGALVLLVLDFYCRFALQETPAHLARPFALLPLRRRALTRVFLLRAMKSWGNLFWLFFLVPFAVISVRPALGWGGVALWLTAYELLFVANALAYLLARTAIARHFAFLALPLAAHAALLTALFSLAPLRHALSLYIYGMAAGHALGFLLPLALIGLLYWANLRLQSATAYDDVARREETVVKIRHASGFHFLDRFGTLGEYLKLELRLRLRNKQVRQQNLVLLTMMVLLTALMYFTPVYDGTFMTSFICLYNYVDLGMASLITIMCFEGNYIDGLMTRRESLLDLLRAKFYFNALLLLLPLLITVPLMCSGKITVWMNFGFMLFTLGVIYPACFQMAVYNKETLPLNQRLAGRQGNMAQNIMAVVILLAPIGIAQAAVVLLGDPAGYILLAALGLAGALSHPLWLRNVYRRMMARRYENMESFRASRGE